MSSNHVSRVAARAARVFVMSVAALTAFIASIAPADDDIVCMPFPPAPRMLVSQVPISNADVVENKRLPLGSRIVLVSLSDPPRILADLTKDFAAAGRPDVSFDGERVLFVGRRRNADVQGIYEIGERGAIREVLRPDSDCLAAVYLSSIYTLGAEAPQPLIAFVQRSADWNTEQVYTCKTDGTDIRRITYAPYGASHPRILSDGRVLYTSGCSPDGSRPRHPQATRVMCVFPDGTDGQLFAPPRNPRASIHDACEIDGLRFAYLLRSRKSLTAPARDAMMIAPTNRSLHAVRHKQASTAPLIAMQAPAAWTDGRIAVSGRTAAQLTWGIYLISPNASTPPRLLFDAPDRHDIAACPLVKRRVPHGRSTVVKENAAAARLYGIDVYLTDTQAAKSFTRGDAKRLRVIQAAPDRKCPATAPIPSPLPDDIILGTAPIESDGSFSLVVPAAVPLRFEILDAEGKILQTMQSWFWLMPNESRGCIGCHADPELSPPNRHPIALWKEPNRIGGATPPEVEDAQPESHKQPTREHAQP